MTSLTVHACFSLQESFDVSSVFSPKVRGPKSPQQANISLICCSLTFERANKHRRMDGWMGGMDSFVSKPQQSFHQSQPRDSTDKKTHLTSCFRTLIVSFTPPLRPQNLQDSPHPHCCPLPCSSTQRSRRL